MHKTVQNGAAGDESKTVELAIQPAA